MQVAYLINQYPNVSHTFIRREILALERQGVRVMRLALRGWRDQLTDPQDRCEREQTNYVLREGPSRLLLALLHLLVTRPLRFTLALVLACRMSWGAERALHVHLV